MDLAALLHALIPSWSSVALLGTFFAYLAAAGSILPGKVVPGATLLDGSRLYYRCNGLVSLLLLVALLGLGAWTDFLRPTIIAERGLELLLTTFIFSTLAYSFFMIVSSGPALVLMLFSDTVILTRRACA